VMCMSLAPFSIMALSNWWRFTFTSADWVMIAHHTPVRRPATQPCERFQL
jgi:hypothetical protein